MAKSTEYPDLTFVEPRAWNSGRPNGRPLWIVVHTTEGSEGLVSAENGAAYDARRTDGTSCHYFHDQDTTIQCVKTGDRANSAKGIGNQRGIHHELCGKAAQTPTQWDDEASAGTIANFVEQAARDSVKWEIPVRQLTVAQVRNYERGFCEHATISAAFGESDHSDPGRNYPWEDVLNAVRDELAPETEEDPMAAFTKDQLVDIAEDAVVNLYVRGYHAILDDAFYAGLNDRDKKQADAVRDFIMTPDLIAGGDPKLRTFEVLAIVPELKAQVAELNTKLDLIIASLSPQE